MASPILPVGALSHLGKANAIISIAIAFNDEAKAMTSIVIAFIALDNYVMPCAYSQIRLCLKGF